MTFFNVRLQKKLPHLTFIFMPREARCGHLFIHSHRPISYNGMNTCSIAFSSDEVSMCLSFTTITVSDFAICATDYTLIHSTLTENLGDVRFLTSI